MADKDDDFDFDNPPYLATNSKAFYFKWKKAKEEAIAKAAAEATKAEAEKSNKPE